MKYVVGMDQTQWEYGFEAFRNLDDALQEAANDAYDLPQEGRREGGYFTAHRD